jgi:hypothetical protein
MLLHMNTMPAGMVLGYMNPKSLTRRTFGNPKLRSPADFNRPEYRRVELPAGNGIGEVRSMAKAYGVFAAGGHVLGIGEDTLEALATPPTPPSLGFRDEVLKAEMSYSLGFNRPSKAFRFGSGEKSFGTIGTGGSFGFADQEMQVGFAYRRTRWAPIYGTTLERKRFGMRCTGASEWLSGRRYTPHGGRQGSVH